LDYRTDDTNNPNQVVTFEDKRKKKKSVTIYLKQKNELANKKYLIGDKCQLMFYEKGMDPKPISNMVKIEVSSDGKSPDPIRWDHDYGLLLHLNNFNIPVGEYKANLDWIVRDTI